MKRFLTIPQRSFTTVHNVTAVSKFPSQHCRSLMKQPRLFQAKSRTFSTKQQVPPESGNRPTPILDFLEVHGGKVAIAGVSTAVYMIYTYYLGTLERRKVEDDIEHQSLAEPYELLQLRYANNINSNNSTNMGNEDTNSTLDGENSDDINNNTNNRQQQHIQYRPDNSFNFSLFEEILKEFNDVPIKDTTITYRDFVQRVRSVIRRYREEDFQRQFPQANGFNMMNNGKIASSSDQKIFSGIRCGYILDRSVQKKLILHMQELEQQSKSFATPSSETNDNAHNGTDSSGLRPRCFVDIENVLKIDFLLVLLQQVLPQHHYKQRIHVLYEIMRMIENSDARTRNDNEEEEQESENNNRMKETVSRGKFLSLS